MPNPVRTQGGRLSFPGETVVRILVRKRLSKRHKVICKIKTETVSIHDRQHFDAVYQPGCVRRQRLPEC